MKIRVILVLLFLLAFSTVNVSAHPGNTDSNGCHYCYTNCEAYGLSYRQYHCHNGSSSSKSYGGNKTNNHKSQNNGNNSAGVALLVAGSSFVAYKAGKASKKKN